jgi:hypothetical protein
MMSDNKIIALIQGMSTQVSAQYQGVGIKSVTFSEPNIFRYTLNDTSSTVVDVPIDNFNNYSLADKAKVVKLITKGDGKSVLYNDGTYKTIDRLGNDNIEFPIATSMWIKDSTIANRYTYTLNHKLNDDNIICTVCNLDNKEELVGVQIIDNDNIVIISDNPIDGKIIINYSTSNSDRISNTATIDSKYVFSTQTEADTYFTATLSALIYGLIIAIDNGTTTKIYKYVGDTNPSTYDNTKWIEQTNFIRGEQGTQGLQGDKGEQGLSAYELALNDGFSGSLSDWFASLNSCLGKFDTLDGFVGEDILIVCPIYSTYPVC